MSLIFSDTSAIIKRHIPEIGTAWVLSWVLPTNDNIIVIAEITTIEVFSTLARRRREGSLSPVNVATSQANFLLHAEKDYLVIPQDDEVRSQARDLINKHPLRALDAIQLASALQAVTILNTPILFISADKNLLAAAAAEGFAVDNPNAHP